MAWGAHQHPHLAVAQTLVHLGRAGAGVLQHHLPHLVPDDPPVDVGTSAEVLQLLAAWS